MDEKKVIDAAYKARRALIHASMAHLRYNIKQSEAGQLYSEMRERDQEAMETNRDLRIVVSEGVPDIYNDIIGDKGKDKEKLDELATMLNELQFTVQIDSTDFTKRLEGLAKKLGIEDSNKKLAKEDADMTPWDSSTE